MGLFAKLFHLFRSGLRRPGFFRQRGDWKGLVDLQADAFSEPVLVAIMQSEGDYVGLWMALVSCFSNCMQ